MGRFARPAGSSAHALKDPYKGIYKGSIGNRV